MKKFFVFVVMLFVTTAIFAQGETTPEVKMLWWQKAILVITGTYEVVVRMIPTVKDWTIIGNLFKFLKVISDAINAGQLKKK